MSKKNRNIETPANQKCRKCDYPLVFRSHKQITQKHLNQPYYFSKWLWCKNCRSIFMDENYKVFNKHWDGKQVKQVSFVSRPSLFDQKQEEEKMRAASLELEKKYLTD